jgi:hypothetical protein
MTENKLTPEQRLEFLKKRTVTVTRSDGAKRVAEVRRHPSRGLETLDGTEITVYYVDQSVQEGELRFPLTLQFVEGDTWSATVDDETWTTTFRIPEPILVKQYAGKSKVDNPRKVSYD